MEPLPDKHDEEFIQTLKSSIDCRIAWAHFGLGYSRCFGWNRFCHLWGRFSGALGFCRWGRFSHTNTGNFGGNSASSYLFVFISRVGAGLGLLIWGAVVVGLVDNIIPIIFMKDKMGVHPMIVLFSMLGGVEIFGAIGFWLVRWW